MTMGTSYLTYPSRKEGMDHSRYPYRVMREAPPMRFSGNIRLAVWLTVHVEWFPLDVGDTPFLPAGAPDRPYPDTQTYTARDYGNRIGIFRLLDALNARGIKPTAAMNSAIAERYPVLVEEIVSSGWEVMAAGIDMGHIHSGSMSRSTERDWIDQSVTTLRKATGQPVLGWHSPANSQSAATPDLLAGAGIEYFADWTNDERPYDFRIENGSLISLPAAYELSDLKILHQHFNRLADFEQQIGAACDILHREAAAGPRILSISLNPWLSGQPYRIASVERVLDHILSKPEVAFVSADELALAHRASAHPEIQTMPRERT